MQLIFKYTLVRFLIFLSTREHNKLVKWSSTICISHQKHMHVLGLEVGNGSDTHWVKRVSPFKMGSIKSGVNNGLGQ